MSIACLVQPQVPWRNLFPGGRGISGQSKNDLGTHNTPPYGKGEKSEVILDQQITPSPPCERTNRTNTFKKKLPLPCVVVVIRMREVIIKSTKKDVLTSNSSHQIENHSRLRTVFPAGRIMTVSSLMYSRSASVLDLK